MACGHIHKDGVDLASLVGGILFEFELGKKGIYTTTFIMNELLRSLSYYSLALQNKSQVISKVKFLCYNLRHFI